MPVDYPASLRPLLRGKARKQPPAFSMAYPRRGMPYTQERGTPPPVIWDVQFRFTRSQAATFWAWFTNDIQRGLLDFNLPIRTEFGLLTYVCQLLPGGLLDTSEEAEVWSYSAQVMARAAITPAAPAAVDPLFAYVMLLLNFEGADTSTTVLDESPYAQHATAGSSSYISTAKSKFGSSSLRIAVRSPQWMSFAGTRFAYPSTGEFCYECFFKGVSFENATNNPVIMRLDNSLGTPLFTAAHYGAGDLMSFRLGLGGEALIPYTPISGNDGWIHLAMTRNSAGDLKWWIDGALKATSSLGGASTGTLTLRVCGAASETGAAQEAYIDSLRVTNGPGGSGAVRYDAPFTPPSLPFGTA